MKFYNFFMLTFFMIIPFSDADLKTPYEKGNGNQTATYEETIAYYKVMTKNFKEVTLLEYGTTDSGKPLHLVVLDTNSDFDPVKTKEKNKTILLINNAIHPGEPEGIDASMLWARDLLTKPALKKLLDNVVVLIIPAYNISGMKNRSCCSRANQNGPEESGFRGNAQNLDLNRDFIKCDTENAHTFAHLFTTWQPDFFIDNHTSNGADYQYVMTYIATQRDKLHPILSDYMVHNLLPDLEQRMTHRQYPMTPYVYSLGQTPDDGIMEFYDMPRYSSGYTTLFNTIGFIAETHMLKPYDQRVEATYYFMHSVLEMMDRDGEQIIQMRAKANEVVRKQTDFDLHWQLDTTRYDWLNFKGYEATYEKSPFGNGQRLKYDRNQPRTKKIRFFNRYNATHTVEKPVAYIVPKAWKKVIQRFENNHIKLSKLTEDGFLEVETYYIADYKTRKNPYEGHYLHYDTQVRAETQTIQFYKGDYVVFCNQAANRFIVETLEPVAPDSYFNWNFFDAILQQKEYFSPYVFEDTAIKLLADNADLKKEFEAALLDTTFANNRRAQLDFVYKRSSYYEPSHLRYPIGRLLSAVEIEGMYE